MRKMFERFCAALRMMWKTYLRSLLEDWLHIPYCRNVEIEKRNGQSLCRPEFHSRCFLSRFHIYSLRWHSPDLLALLISVWRTQFNLECRWACNTIMMIISRNDGRTVGARQGSPREPSWAGCNVDRRWVMDWIGNQGNWEKGGWVTWMSRDSRICHPHWAGSRARLHSFWRLN